MAAVGVEAEMAGAATVDLEFGGVGEFVFGTD